MNCYYNQYCRNATIVWIHSQVNSSVFALRATPGQDGVYFAMLFMERWVHRQDVSFLHFGHKVDICNNSRLTA